jgi:DNA-binding response OmpR family regulator
MGYILLVDDEPMLLRIMARALRDAGHSVIEAHDGMSALMLAQNTPKPFELVVTNSSLPGLSGRELIARLRELYPSQPILHLTGHARGERLGYEGLPPDVPTLYKPLHMEELVQEVGGLLAGVSAE